MTFSLKSHSTEQETKTPTTPGSIVRLDSRAALDRDSIDNERYWHALTLLPTFDGSLVWADAFWEEDVEGQAFESLEDAAVFLEAEHGELLHIAPEFPDAPWVPGLPKEIEYAAVVELQSPEGDITRVYSIVEVIMPHGHDYQYSQVTHYASFPTPSTLPIEMPGGTFYKAPKDSSGWQHRVLTPGFATGWVN